MAQARMISKALRVRRILKKLARAKENRIRELVGLPPVRSWYEQCFSGISSSIRECLCRSFCPCCVGVPTYRELCCPKGSFGFKLCSDGYYHNDVMKSFLAFFLGLALSMGLYFFLCLQMEANLIFAWTVSMVMGLVLSIGLAFFSAVRCVVFISLPNFCSGKGRAFLILYAMVLIMNHPVQNFSHNLTVLTDAATCGQSMSLNETKKLVESAASPLLSVLAGIKEMLRAVRRLADELRKAFKALVRAVTEIATLIGKMIKWLASMVNICNENMGEPYQKCKKAFDDGYRKCKDKLGIFDFMCGIVSLVGKVCHITRIGELLCVIAGAIKDLVISKVAPPVLARIDDVKEMFYFNVSIDYHYEYNMNQSRSYSAVRDAILQEIKDKLSIIDVVQSILDNITSFTILLVIFKGLMYRRNYLNKDNFDNVYITRHLFEIDARRIETGKETIFPLKMKEKLKYLKTFSMRLNKSEAYKMTRGLLFWLFAVFHATYYILCDYGLYWILDLIRTHMDFSTKTGIPPHLKLHVQGNGPMPDIYKSMAGVVEPIADDGLDISTTACLPKPYVPNYTAYKTVLAIFLITLFLTLFEAYGLRLRHVVAACYYPYRERFRAVWLYNHILLMRGSFLVMTRRQLHRKRANDKAIEKLSVISRLTAQFFLCRLLMKFMGRSRKHCLSCGLEGKTSDMDNFVHCDNCKTPYCNDCFVALDNICTACMNPVDYGDSDDISVETDSSEDEQDKAIRVRRLQERKQKVVKRQKDRSPGELMKAFQQRFSVPTSPSQLALAENQQEDGDNEESEVSEDENKNREEDSEEKSSSQYDTDYQYRSASSTSGHSEDEKPRKKLVRRRPEMVTVDIFHKPYTL